MQRREVSKEMSEGVKNSDKTPQSVLDKCRYDYQIGNFKTIEELASRYGMNSVTLHGRMRREGWKEERERKLMEVEAKLCENALSEADSWLKTIRETTKKDLKILSSRLNLNEEQIKNLDYEELTALIRTKKVVDDMARRSLGLSDSIDVTSKGQSLGESLVSAIQRLREDPNRPKLSEDDKRAILEAEIVDENGGKT